MTGFFMFLHALVCILLATIILMQSGRGGGLTEGFAGAESMFGAKTNEFMIKATTLFSVLFLTTCLVLAVLSARKDRSLMSTKAVHKTSTKAATKKPVPPVKPVSGDKSKAPAAKPTPKPSATPAPQASSAP